MSSISSAIVLRSWEARFGAHVVALTPSTVSLTVSQPPQGVEARRLAEEYFALQPDNPLQPLDVAGAEIAGTRLRPRTRSS